MTKACILLTISLLLASCGSKRNCDILVSNPSDNDRCQLVEVSRFPDGIFVLNDEKGNEVPYQITSDKKLVFISKVPTGKTVGYRFGKGTPAKVDTICYGRVFPERMDDLAWENDRSAYRAYGPALQASGEKAYGYDIWTKSVGYPVLEKRFHDDIVNKVSYHVDHGEGMDVYAVGPTLGGGTSAIITENDSIVYPYCWESAEVLDNGPLRFTARLTYPPCVIDGDTIIEKRLITLDAGNWLNKTTVTYEGLEGKLRPMAGIVVHDSNSTGYTVGANSVAYCDLTQQPHGNNGEIYIALYSPELSKARYIPLTQKKGDALGHIALTGNPGQREFTYYWGSGWSKGGVGDFDTWNKHIAAFEKNINRPLIVKTK